MKTVLFAFLFIAPSLFSQNMYKEMDDKKEFFGIPFMSKPDYSKLVHFKAGPDFNAYTFKNGMLIKGPDYAFFHVNVVVQKGVIVQYNLELHNPESRDLIIRDLKAAFPGLPPVVTDKSVSYVGKNATFMIIKNSPKDYFSIVPYGFADIPSPKDETGLTSMSLKKISDTSVAKILKWAGNDFEKKTEPHFNNQWHTYYWKEKGIEMLFSISSQTIDTVLISMTLYLSIDKKNKFFKGWKPYTEPLPFGLEHPLQYSYIIDKLGTPHKTDFDNPEYINPKITFFTTYDYAIPKASRAVQKIQIL